MTLTFEERGPNETELTLHHVGFPSETARDNHRQGWGTILDLVATTVS